MRVQEQTTLGKPVSMAGVGLHTGVEATVVLKPAREGFGVRFVRTDLKAENGSARPLNETTIFAAPRFVRDARLGVWLENPAGASVRTVEHLMAALFLSGVDNALIEIDGPEVPILDGSACAFMDMLAEAGVKRVAAPREAIVMTSPLRIESGDRFVEVLPAPATRFDVTIDYAETAIGRRSVTIDLSEGGVERLVQARTFCSLGEIEGMRAAGLALGGSLDNAIVVDGARLLNPAGLRDPDEFVLHKALDLIGDLALLGAPLQGLVRAYKPGHDLNTRLARLIAESASASERRPMREAARDERLTA